MKLRAVEQGSPVRMGQVLWEKIPQYAERVIAHEWAHIKASPVAVRCGILMREGGQVVGAFVRPLLEGVKITRELCDRMVGMAMAPKGIGDQPSEQDYEVAKGWREIGRWFDMGPREWGTGRIG